MISYSMRRSSSAANSSGAEAEEGRRMSTSGNPRRARGREEYGVDMCGESLRGELWLGIRDLTTDIWGGCKTGRGDAQLIIKGSIVCFQPVRRSIAVLQAMPDQSGWARAWGQPDLSGGDSCTKID